MNGNDSVSSGQSLCISAKPRRDARGGVPVEIATGTELGRSKALHPEYFDSQALGIRLNEGTRTVIKGKAL